MLAIKTLSPLRRSSPTKIDLLGAAQEGNLSAKAARLEVPGQGQGVEPATEAATVTKVLVMCSEVANAVVEVAREAAIEAVREAAREEDIEMTRDKLIEVTREEVIEVTRDKVIEVTREVTKEMAKEKDIEVFP